MAANPAQAKRERRAKLASRLAEKERTRGSHLLPLQLCLPPSAAALWRPLEGGGAAPVAAGVGSGEGGEALGGGAFLAAISEHAANLEAVVDAAEADAEAEAAQGRLPAAVQLEGAALVQRMYALALQLSGGEAEEAGRAEAPRDDQPFVRHAAGKPAGVVALEVCEMLGEREARQRLLRELAAPLPQPDAGASTVAQKRRAAGAAARRAALRELLRLSGRLGQRLGRGGVYTHSGAVLLHDDEGRPRTAPTAEGGGGPRRRPVRHAVARTRPSRPPPAAAPPRPHRRASRAQRRASRPPPRPPRPRPPRRARR